MIIPIKKRSVRPYGELSNFLREYAKSGVDPKSYKELALEFYGSDDLEFTARVRATVTRINRRKNVRDLPTPPTPSLS